MGQLIEIIPKTLFSFDGRIGTTQIIVLKDFVNTVGFSSGALVVRVHAVSGIVTGASAKVVAYNQSRDRDDPGVFFAGSQIAATDQITSTSAGKLEVAQLTPPISSAVRVTVEWSQGGTAASGPQLVTIAVDLVGRE
jgi:hypothetical protein